MNRAPPMNTGCALIPKSAAVKLPGVRRWLFNLAAAVSLVLCVVVVAWTFNWRCDDGFAHIVPGGNGVQLVRPMPGILGFGEKTTGTQLGEKTTGTR
jgi:hypothetical protein